MKGPLCRRLRIELEAMHKLSRHSTKADDKRRIAEHWCPECSGWEVRPGTPRDPQQPHPDDDTAAP